MSILDDITKNTDNDFFDYDKYREEQEKLKKLEGTEPPKKPDKKDTKKKSEKKDTADAEKEKKLAAEKAKFEAEKAEREKKLAEEKAAKDAKLAAEKAKLEAEKAEREKKLAEEKAEKEKKLAAEKVKLEAEKAEREKKLAEEKAEKEKKLAAEKAKLEAEKAEREKALAIEKAEQEKKKAEELKKLEEEKKAAEKARLEAEKAAKQKKLAEEKKKAEELKKAEAEKKAAEKERKAKEAAENKDEKKSTGKFGLLFGKKNADKKPPIDEAVKEAEEAPIKENAEKAPVKEAHTTDKEPVTMTLEEMRQNFLSMKTEKPAEEEKAVVKTEKRIRTEKKIIVHHEDKEKSSEILHAIDSALDEDVNELAEFSDEPDTPVPVERRNTFKRSVYFATGVLVSVMALIGFVFTIIFICDMAGRVANNTRQKEMFTEIVYPLVITNPASFENVNQLSSDTMLSAAIWDLILYEDTSKYNNEFGNITVPQADVELHATKLFGPGLTFNHHEIGDISLTFYYDAEQKSYIIPVSPQYFTYSPQIEEISRSGDTYTVLVGYISPVPAWMAARDEEAALPVKYVEYSLLKSNNKYTIVSIKEVEGLGIGDKAE